MINNHQQQQSLKMLVIFSQLHPDAETQQLWHCYCSWVGKQFFPSQPSVAFCQLFLQVWVTIPLCTLTKRMCWENRTRMQPDEHKKMLLLCHSSCEMQRNFLDIVVVKTKTRRNLNQVRWTMNSLSLSLSEWQCGSQWRLLTLLLLFLSWTHDTHMRWAHWALSTQTLCTKHALSIEHWACTQTHTLSSKHAALSTK